MLCPTLLYYMKNIFILALVCAIASGCHHAAIPSSTPVVNTQIQSANGAAILAGHCSLSMLGESPYKDWFDKAYNAYMVDAFTVHTIQPMLANKTIEVFLGSWCGDSKREVPRLIKILQAAKFDTANLKLVFVNNAPAAYRQSPQHEEVGKGIHRVPTIIVYNNKGEMGRIVESPRISLEKDLLAILLRQPYKPNYYDVYWWVNNVHDKDSPLNTARLTQIASTVKPVCPNMYHFNTYGYVLLAQKNYTEAINVFTLNTLMFPTLFGTYDSLGEAYMMAGDKQKARENYKKVLQLHPGDENATKMLAQLQ